MKRTILLLVAALLAGCSAVCAHIPTTPLVQMLPGVCPASTATPTPTPIAAK